MANQTFDFYVTGLEDGLIAALRAGCAWAKEVTTYAGELDEVAIREALSRLVNRMPLILVTYGQGEDVLSPATAAVAADKPTEIASTAGRPGGEIAVHHTQPRVYQHNCMFTAIVVSNDMRGEQARRRGIANQAGLYRMMADVKGTIDDIQFSVLDPVNGTILLNVQPFKPIAVDYLAKLPDLTAYAVHWETAFKYITPDRTVTATPINQLIFGLEPQVGVEGVEVVPDSVEENEAGVIPDIE